MFKTKKQLAVFTDLEPDDLIALGVLFKSGFVEANNIIFIISAWQDVRHKARYFRKFLQDNFPDYSNSLIYLGEPNDKTYLFPFELAPDEDFLSYQSFNPRDSLIINLSPIRELMFYFKQDPKVFEDCELAIYGSFNIRSVLLSKSENPETVREMLDSFSEVLCYESFWANPDVNSMTDPDLLDQIQKNNHYLSEVIAWWNGVMMDDCRQSCQKSDPSSEKYKRNKKVLDNIEACPGQFVNADTGLIAVLVTPELHNYAQPGRIGFDPVTGYTKFEENNDSRIKMVKCTNGNLWAKQIEVFKRLLN